MIETRDHLRYLKFGSQKSEGETPHSSVCARYQFEGVHVLGGQL